MKIRIPIFASLIISALWGWLLIAVAICKLRECSTWNNRGEIMKIFMEEYNDPAFWVVLGLVVTGLTLGWYVILVILNHVR